MALAVWHEEMKVIAYHTELQLSGLLFQTSKNISAWGFELRRDRGEEVSLVLFAVQLRGGFRSCRCELWTSKGTSRVVVGTEQAT